jgi:hypothetical protein
MKRRVMVILLAGVFLLTGLGQGLAQNRLVLNSTYVPYNAPKGWVRVWSQGSSKFVQDDAIAGRSLVKFDISHIPFGTNVTSCTL